MQVFCGRNVTADYYTRQNVYFQIPVHEIVAITWYSVIKNETLTYIWNIQKEFSMGLKVRPEEDLRCHGPGRTFVWVQESLLRNSISQEKNHHDQKKIH